MYKSITLLIHAIFLSCENGYILCSKYVHFVISDDIYRLSTLSCRPLDFLVRLTPDIFRFFSTFTPESRSSL